MRPDLRPQQSGSPLAALILAAGRGTRMRSERPKLLHEVGGQPLVHHGVARCLELGAAPVVLVLPPDGAALRASLEAFAPAALRYAVQEEPRGTADAVRAGLGALEGAPERLLILAGDVPNLDPSSLRELVACLDDPAVAMALLTFRLQPPGAYGRVVRATDGSVACIVEARDADAATLAIDELNSGVYVIRTPLLRELLAGIGSDNAQGEFYLTDTIAAAAQRGLRVLGVPASATSVAGVNDRADLAAAQAEWRRRRNLALLRAGVTMDEPDSVWVDEASQLAADVHLEPNVRILGACNVAAGARICAGSILRDCQVAAAATVHPYCVCEGAQIGPQASVGPFARLRAGTELGARVKIGNFVETKKARIGEGSKASHLTYLGDAVLGRDVNVGCGTITCNYDGFRKYPTTVGDGCLIGSDTALVAPVTLGDHVITGAGSVITNDVPSGTLAVSRGRQRNVEGYWERLRRRYLRDEES